MVDPSPFVRSFGLVRGQPLQDPFKPDLVAQVEIVHGQLVPLGQGEKQPVAGDGAMFAEYPAAPIILVLQKGAGMARAQVQALDELPQQQDYPTANPSPCSPMDSTSKTTAQGASRAD